MKHITFFYSLILFCCFSCNEKSKSYYNQPTKIIEQTIWSIKQYENGNILPESFIAYNEDEHSFIGYYNAEDQIVKEYRFIGDNFEKPDKLHFFERNSNGLIEKEETKSVNEKYHSPHVLITYKRDLQGKLIEKETKEDGKVVETLIDEYSPKRVRTTLYNGQKTIEEPKLDDKDNLIELHSKTYNEFGLSIDDIWRKFIYKEGKEVAYICTGTYDYYQSNMNLNTVKETNYLKKTASLFCIIFTHYDEHGSIVKEIELNNPSVKECAYPQDGFLSAFHVKAYNDVNMEIISEGEAYAKKHLQHNYDEKAWFQFTITSYTYKYNSKGEWVEKIKYINDTPIYMVKRKIEYINN